MASKTDAPVVVSGDALAKAFEIGAGLTKPTSPGDGGIPFVVVPQGYTVATLESMVYHKHREFPTRREARVSVDDAASFIEYFQRFREEDSAIFAKQERGTVTAILDYHGRPEKRPRWCAHSVTLALHKSEEWAAWMQQSGQKMSQSEFAEFIEDHTPEFSRPDAATMLEIATTMKASSEASMESGIRLSNGSIRFAWNETISGKFGSGQVECPEMFTIRVAVYQGMLLQEVTCRLRYRVAGGKLAMWFDILRASAIERDAFASVLSEIKQATGETIIAGAV